MMKSKYLSELLQSKNIHILPPEIKSSLLNEANLMSDLGVENEDDHVQFLIILQHTPDLLSKLMPSIPVDEELASRVAAKVFSDRAKRPIDSMLNLMLSVAEAASSLGLPVHKEAVEKWGYPQGFEGNEPRPTYDLNKWMRATRDIYLKVQQGETQSEAEKSATKDWDKMENTDYHNWLKFYRERVPEKYPKLANFYTSDDTPGMYIPNPVDFSSLKGKIPHPIEREREDDPLKSVWKKREEKKEEKEGEDVLSVRDQIEFQRSKIVSRLNAAERLLASMEGQYFAGNEQEIMLKLLQDLKRKVQIANKISIKSSLFEDYIYRTANMLKFHGRDRAANFFYKIAMPPLGAPPGPLGAPPVPAGPPTGGPPTEGPLTTGEPKAGDAKGTKQAFKEFIDGLNRRFPGDDDDTRRERRKKEREAKKESAVANSPKAPPTGEVPPSPAAPPPPPAAPVTGGYEDDGDIVVTAQIAGAPPEPILPAETAGPPDPRARPLTPRVAPPSRPVPEAGERGDLTVREDEPVTTDDKTDDIIDAALKEVTIGDVIRRLEMLVSIYNQREISRQINILDIMMDRIGLASFFPALAEAMGKAIESGNYISTRLEDILTKLKGSAESVEGQQWLEPQRNLETPETATVRKGLEKREEEEELRKSRRRERELAKARGQIPEGGAGAAAPAELATPAAMPPPARPIATR
jgi:hypothetical protein